MTTTVAKSTVGGPPAPWCSNRADAGTEFESSTLTKLAYAYVRIAIARVTAL
jgi:hypothetical protein